LALKCAMVEAAVVESLTIAARKNAEWSRLPEPSRFARPGRFLPTEVSVSAELKSVDY